MKCRFDPTGALAGLALLVPNAALAQSGTAPKDAKPEESSTRDDIIVKGKRLPGSIIGDTAPVAKLNAAAIQALGATSISDLLQRLKPLTTSVSGAEPVFLLNGRRVSSFNEIAALPPEALNGMEVLPESESARFGFPPTVRIVNYITKKKFGSLSVDQSVGTTTQGGGDTASLKLGSTRIDGSFRNTLTVSYERQDPLPNTRRRTFADPNSLFNPVGTIASPNGGSIDPALDALAGRGVTSAAVPGGNASSSLAGYLSGANAPRAFNLAPYQSVAGNDALSVDGTLALPISDSVSASVNLKMSAQRGSGLAGLGSAVLLVPAGNPALPFSKDVLLYRYLVEAGPLRQRNSDLTLHAGGALQGSIQRWNWTLTGNYDRTRLNAMVEQGFDTDAAQAAISAGGNPFLPITAAGGLRIVNRSQTTTDTIVGNVVANGPVFRLPAGAAQVTVTGDLNRSSSRGGQVGMADTRVRRTLGSGNVSLNLPIASADQGVLAAIGTLNADGAIGVSAVSGYRQLVNSTLSTTWAPIHAIQVTASVSTTQTPPSIERLTSPIVSTPNTPFFDFVRGESRLVTVITGGNPDLGPERRRISALGVSVQPLKSKEFRINIDYTDTVVTGQVSNPGGATPALQAALPERFVRNAAGQLQQADLRPFALARERDRALRATVSLFETLGSKPGFSEEVSDDPTAVSSASAELARPMIFAFAVFTRRLEDRLTLRPGQPELDLLNGETLNGSGGRPRYEAQGSFGGSYGPVQASLSTAWQAPTRIRSAIAASDLSFSGKTIIGLEATLNVAAIASMAWVQKLTFQLDIQNLLNDRMEVRDRNGQTPFNFQPNFLDPYGRIIRFGLRKLF